MIDPTPAAGQPSAYGGAHVLRLLLDRALTGWSRLIVWLKTANLLLVLAEAGIGCFEFLHHFIRSPLGWLVSLGVAVWIGWRRRRVLLSRSPEERYRQRLAKEMQRRMKRSVPAALWRLESESWDGWMSRLEGKIPDETFQALRLAVEQYQCRRYRSKIDLATPPTV